MMFETSHTDSNSSEHISRGIPDEYVDKRLNKMNDFFPLKLPFVLYGYFWKFVHYDALVICILFSNKPIPTVDHI